jgi:hypothetical protein
MVTNRKTPILWGKGAVICATGGGATKRDMEHFSSALSGVSTNCADRGAQKMFSYFSLYALPLYVVSEIDNVATSARQNPELLPAKIHASGRERMRLHLPNLTKREICAGNNSQSVNVADGLSRVRNGPTIYLSPFGDRQRGGAAKRVGGCLFAGIPAGINPAARYAPNGYGFASAHRLVHFAVALSGRPFCAVLGYPSATRKGGAEIAPALDPLKPRANVLPVFHGYRARPDAEERMPLLQAGLSRFPVFSAAKSHLPNLTKREICVGNNSHAAAFCAPGNACFAGPRLALQLRQIGTTSNGRS